jgi:hypothetical protein
MKSLTPLDADRSPLITLKTLDVDRGVAFEQSVALDALQPAE